MLIESEDHLNKQLALIDKAEFVAVDTETHPLEDGRVPNIAGISVYTRVGPVGTGFYLPVNHIPMMDREVSIFGLSNYPELLDRVIDTVRGKKLLFHNAKFDIGVLDKAGHNLLDEKFYCTMVMSAMLNENGDYSFGAGNGLAAVAKKYGCTVQEQDRIKKMAKKLKNNYARIPPKFMAPYAVEDTKLTYEIFPQLQEDLVRQEMYRLVSREMSFLRVLYRIERQGTRIDPAKCRQFAAVAQLRLKELRDEAGFDLGSPREVARRLFLPPPLGLGLPVGERGTTETEEFPEGVPSTGKPYLQTFDHLPLVELVLEYRGRQKALSTWFNGFLEKMDDDHKLHPNYRQAGTRTGRLSCSKPNLQQIPRTTEEEREQGTSKSRVKELFLAEPGYTLYEFDYSQAELRLATAYSKDTVLLEAYRTGADMHQTTANSVGISRQDAKTLNFAIQYGAGSAKIAKMLGITLEEAKDMIAKYWAGYPNLANLKYQSMIKADSKGYVRYWTGKRRHFPVSGDGYKAFNSVIQGGVGEIVKTSMLKLAKELNEVIMVNQVHDSIWILIPNHDEELENRLVERVTEIMEWPTEQFKLPFPVDKKEMHRA